MVDTGVVLITVAPCHCQVALSQIGCCGDLVGASTVSLLNGQGIVGGLEVGHDLLHQFLVSELIITGLFFRVYRVDLLVNPGNLVPHLHQLEVEVCTEETDLTFADGLCLGIHRCVVGQRHQCTVATADGAIEVIPELVHVVRSGSGQ